MNPGRGWNPNLKELYLLEYSEYEAEIFTQSTSGAFCRSVKTWETETYSIPRYNECTKTNRFSILGFF